MHASLYSFTKWTRRTSSLFSRDPSVTNSLSLETLWNHKIGFLNTCLLHALWPYSEHQVEDTTCLAVTWGGTPALGYRITFTRAFFVVVCFFLEIENFFGLFLFELGHLAGWCHALRVPLHLFHCREGLTLVSVSLSTNLDSDTTWSCSFFSANCTFCSTFFSPHYIFVF